MSKKHKFLVLVGFSDHYSLEDGFSEEELDQIRTCEDGCGLVMVTCHHEKWEDNLVTLHGNKFLRDCNGALYSYWESLSKADVVRMFEIDSE